MSSKRIKMKVTLTNLDTNESWDSIQEFNSDVPMDVLVKRGSMESAISQAASAAFIELSKHIES
jgi:hypothetical protein